MYNFYLPSWILRCQECVLPSGFSLTFFVSPPFLPNPNRVEWSFLSAFPLLYGQSNANIFIHRLILYVLHTLASLVRALQIHPFSITTLLDVKAKIWMYKEDKPVLKHIQQIISTNTFLISQNPDNTSNSCNSMHLFMPSKQMSTGALWWSFETLVDVLHQDIQLVSIKGVNRFLHLSWFYWQQNLHDNIQGSILLRKTLFKLIHRYCVLLLCDYFNHLISGRNWSIP